MESVRQVRAPKAQVQIGFSDAVQVQAQRRASIATSHRQSLIHPSRQSMAGLPKRSTTHRLGRGVLALVMYLVFSLCVGWLVCLAVRPRFTFCDTEYGGNSQLHSDCEPCPSEAFCALGRIFDCETSIYSQRECVADIAGYHKQLLRSHTPVWALVIVGIPLVFLPALRA
mmetsp:Transcript_78344/g.138408  ORF Transcript_78344/g.138408 Transcript_78344/m.138408 type:complete len:170 (+) Transcript_78344:571-1080(+)